MDDTPFKRMIPQTQWADNAGGCTDEAQEKVAGRGGAQGSEGGLAGEDQPEVFYEGQLS